MRDSNREVKMTDHSQQRVTDLQARVEAAKRFQFLRRVHHIAGGRTERFVPAGDLGVEMGLPYEDALRIVKALAREGLLEPVGDLIPPHGPRVHLTRRGIYEVGHHAA